MSITIRKLPYPVVLLVALATWQAHADNVMLPEQIRVPAGSKEIAAMHAVGDLTYECKVQANDASAYSWQVLGPEAQLSAKNGKMKGEAVLIFNEELIANAPYYQKQTAELFSKNRFIAGQ